MCASTMYEKNGRQIHGRLTRDISDIQGRSTLDISHIQGRSAQSLIQGRRVGASTLHHLRYRVDAHMHPSHHNLRGSTVYILTLV